MGGANTRWAWLLLSAASLLSATPVLRLSNTAVSVQSNVLQAYNAGDGTLVVAVSIPQEVPWLTASVGGSCPSGTPPSCVLIQFNFNTEKLAAGMYTASVTVLAQGAVDSPQIVTAAVVVVGSYYGVDSYLSMGATSVIAVTPPCASHVDTYTSAQDGGTWLWVAKNTLGSADCPSYDIHLTPTSSMVPGTYSGNFEQSGFIDSVGIGHDYGFSIPVTMHLVAQSLAVPSPIQIKLTLAQGGPVMNYPFVPAISLDATGAIPATSATASDTGVSASVSGGLVFV
jgi:hypothetical protein